jgi:hypothetical protein
MCSCRPTDRSDTPTTTKAPGVGTRCSPLLLAFILMTLPSLRADRALSAVRPVGTPPQTAGKSHDGTSLDTVTIEAARKKKELWRHAGRFVSSVTFTYLYDSLPRWDKPICPLVAGLPRKQGEYILGRITQVATAAQAPLAGEHCRPNLYVVATPYPDLLLKKWWARDVNMYNECSGLGGVKAFLHSKRRIRVWYNTVPADGGSFDHSTASLFVNVGANFGCITGSHSPAIGLSQVIVVVDMRQMNGVDIGQLADYVSMIGLAQIRLDALPAGPSILTLVENEKDAPEGLSAWDRALLYALYHTPQEKPEVQGMLMRSSMVSQISSGH